jgi:hypothetical protein
VPRISEFFGIVVTMYYNDHAPPHFHARYAEHEAQLEIDSLEVLHGSLPPPQLALVQAWGSCIMESYSRTGSGPDGVFPSAASQGSSRADQED